MKTKDELKRELDQAEAAYYQALAACDRAEDAYRCCLSSAHDQAVTGQDSNDENDDIERCMRKFGWTRQKATERIHIIKDRERQLVAQARDEALPVDYPRGRGKLFKS